jgi:hypothetical protein
MTDQGRDGGTLRLRAEGLHWQDIEGEVVALQARASQYVAVNRAGTRLWRALAHGGTRTSLAGELADAYGLPYEQALADTDAFLAQLRAQGLLQE